MGYKFFKIDSWDNEIAYLKVDMKTVFSQNYEFEGTQICGWNIYTDKADLINVNFTHSAPNMTIEITTTLDTSPDDESFGIREIFILVDYVRIYNSCMINLTPFIYASVLKAVLHAMHQDAQLVQGVMFFITKDAFFLVREINML